MHYLIMTNIPHTSPILAVQACVAIKKLLADAVWGTKKLVTTFSGLFAALALESKREQAWMSRGGGAA
jgi:hypothetical protein